MSDNQNVIRRNLKDISHIFIAQGITLAISLLKALWIPKILGIEDFSYWQLFLFYSGYIGFFQFGLNDGIYLRYGGKQYSHLNKSIFRSQFWLLLFSQIILALFLIIVSEVFLTNQNRIDVIKYTSICLVITGISAFFWFVFQSVNKVQEYALSLIVEKVTFCIIILVFWLLGIKKLEYFIGADLLSRIAGLIFCIYIGRALVIGKLSSLSLVLIEIKGNISVGMKLMLANIASMLVIGLGRLTIDYKWGIKTFGAFSLSLSIISMILLFINAISIILFPKLRNIPKEKIGETYNLIRATCIILLTGFLIMYFPIQKVLTIWLPQYAESIKFLGVLFPICIFDGKMQMLVATYLKAIRRENFLLKANVVSVIYSLIASVFSVMILENINYVIFSIISAVIIRCIIAELYLANLLGISVKKDLISEVCLVVIFVLIISFLDIKQGFLVYLFVYIGFLYLNRHIIFKTLKFIKIHTNI